MAEAAQYSEHGTWLPSGEPRAGSVGLAGSLSGSRAALLIVSLLYLAVGVAYASRALDAVVTPLNLTAMQSLAEYGKLLLAAGIGLLTLRVLFAGRLLFHVRYLRWFASPVVQCLIVGAAVFGSIGASQWVETAHLVHASTVARAQSLRDLVLLAAATRPPDESELASRVATPAGRALLALRLVSTGQITDQIDDQRSATALAVRSLVAKKIGTPPQVFDHIFVPSVRSVLDAFNEYVAAQEQLANAIRAIPQQQINAWDRYTAALAARGLSPTRLNVRDLPGALGDAQQAGAPVAMDWNPADKPQFLATVGKRLADAAQAAYDERVSNLLGATLPPGLSWERFVSEPLIQARWSRAIGAPGVALSPNLKLPEFRETVYSVMVARASQPIAALMADPDQDRETSVAIAAWHFVPARAFCSLLLVIAALVPFALWDVLALAGISRPVRFQLAALVVIAGFFVWYGPFVINSDLRAGASTVPMPAPLTVAAMKAAPMIHDAGNAIRNGVLGGFGFGCDLGDLRNGRVGIPAIDQLLKPA